MSIDDQIRSRLESLVEPVVDPDEVTKAILRRARPVQRARRRVWFAAAAVLAVIVAAAALAVSVSQRSSNVVAGRGDTSTATHQPIERQEIPFSLLWTGPTDNAAPSIGIATGPEQFRSIWATATGDSVQGPGEPLVDFQSQLVVSIAMPNDRCPTRIDGFEQAGSTLIPIVTASSGPCEDELSATAFVVALDWAATGDDFTVQLEGGLFGESQTELTVLRPNRPVALDGTVRGTIVLPTTVVRSGEAVTAEVIVRNGTGQPIATVGCGSPYLVAVHSVGAQPEFVETLCANPFSLPPGESRWPIEINTALQSCSSGIDDQGAFAPCQGVEVDSGLPPGRYMASVQGAGAPQAPSVALDVSEAG